MAASIDRLVITDLVVVNKTWRLPSSSCTGQVIFWPGDPAAGDREAIQAKIVDSLPQNRRRTLTVTWFKSIEEMRDDGRFARMWG